MMCDKLFINGELSKFIKVNEKLKFRISSL